MIKAIFLDRDGTITKSGNHIYKLEDLEFVQDAIIGLKKFQEMGYKLIVVTNQAGIAKGLYTEKDYFIFTEEMHRQLNEYGVIIAADYFCPHHPEKGFEGEIKELKINCNCRKPKTGMLEQAAKELNLNLSECWMIGDNPSDIDAGKNAGCRTIHVLTGECKNPIEYADFAAKDLIEAANYILNNP